MCLVLFYCERGDKMAIVPQPAFLPSAFAALGDKNIIPASNDGTGGLASMALGFPPITQQPLAEGGLPPQRGDFNGIFNLITQFLMYMQAGGVFGYAETIDYQPPSVIWADNNLYKCKKSNGPSTANGVQPITNTDYWELVSIPISVTENGGKITITQGDSAGTSFYAAINLIERNKAYTVGDMAWSPNLPSWAYLECTTAGTTAAKEPSFADVTEDTSVTDGTAVFVVRRVSTAQKLRTGTVGNTSKPIYLNAGTPTAISATVGAANKPIYLNAGTPTAASGNIGAALTPIYMLNGVFTACSQALGAASNGGIIAANLAQNGYVKFANGLILQWGKYYISAGTDNRKQTFSYPVAFSNACYATIGIDGLVFDGEWMNSVVVTAVAKNNFTVGVGHGEASTFWAISIGE